MASTMLSTIDNPYNPFSQFDEWYAYDMVLARQEGRNTCCGYLAAISQMSSDVTDSEYDAIIEQTIDDICELNLNGKFIKVTENSGNMRENDENSAKIEQNAE